MRDDCLAVERLDLQAEVIEVARLLAGGCAALLSQWTVHRHQIDQGAPGTKLPEADVLLDLLLGAAEHVDVEVHHCPQVDDPQHQMVQLRDPQHGHLSIKGPGSSASWRGGGKYPRHV